VESEQLLSPWQAPLGSLTTQACHFSAIKQVSAANSNPVPSSIQQSPACGCQREAHGKEATEKRAEDEAGGVTVPLQFKKKKDKEKSHVGSWRLQVLICISSGSHLHRKSYP
jgi:hypothetical protein